MKTENRRHKVILLELGLILTSMVLLHACGSPRQDDAPDAAKENTTQQPATGPTGGFNLSCGKQLPQQYQQAGYQQQQGCVAQSGGKKGQAFAFKDSRVSDFDLSLDCANRVVVAQSKTALDQQTAIPIGADGSIKGSLSYPQQVLGDGYGSEPCYVQLAVAFDGTAKCNELNGKGVLALKTEVSFLASSLTGPAPGSDVVRNLPEDSHHEPRRTADDRDGDRDRERDGDWRGGRGEDHYRDYPQPGPVAGPVPVPVPVPGPIPGPGPGPGPIPLPAPVPVQGPIPVPLPIPSQGPGAGPVPVPVPVPVPEPGPIPGPAPAPAPGLPGRKGCVVRNPCPIVTKTDLSCPE